NLGTGFGLALNRGRFDGPELVFPAATIYTDQGHLLDRPSLAYDPDFDRLYAVYLDETSHVGRCNASSDGGATWIGARTLTSATAPNGFQVCPGPDGTVYVAWVDPSTTGDGKVWVRRSTDGGLTWESALEIAQLGSGAAQPPRCYNRTYQVPAPTIAVDRTNGPHRGRVYCAYTDGASGTFDVFLRHSDDTGGWSEAKKLNEDTGTTEQFWPKLHLGPDGRLTAFWYDRRASDGGNGLCDVYATQTVDGGEIWGPNRRISDISASWCGVPSNLAPNFGEYLALGGDDRSAFFSWSDARSGGIDVYFARVDDRHDATVLGTLSGGGATATGTSWSIADAFDVVASPAPPLTAPLELAIVPVAYALLASPDETASLVDLAGGSITGEALLGTSTGPIEGSFTVSVGATGSTDLSFTASSGGTVGTLLPNGPFTANLQASLVEPGRIALYGQLVFTTTGGPENVSVYTNLDVSMSLDLQQRLLYTQVGSLEMETDLRLHASTRVSTTTDTPTDTPPFPGDETSLLQVTPLPNPDPERIAMQLARPGPFRLRMLDAGGRVLRVWTDDALDAGRYEVPFRHIGSGGIATLAPGAYFLELQQGTARAHSKVIVLSRNARP
ncbi:MAG: exo-alpha-sialidase, partial [Candidatus Eisenbacteria bacterium]|nr:exo-alpha-sialidase [Candidatus Eisenbacteria bacterium]